MKDKDRYERLLEDIRGWSAEAGAHDAVGVLHLLRAAADNLAAHSIPADFEPELIWDVYTTEQIAILERIVQAYREGEAQYGSEE